MAPPADLTSTQPTTERAVMEFCEAVKSSRTSCAPLDFKIICGDKTHHVHRFVISMHSGFFGRLCANGSVNHTKQSATLYGDEPRAIDAMIEYFYTFKILPRARSVGEKIDNFAHVLSTIFTTADKYNITNLKDLAVEEIRHCLEWCGAATSLSKYELEEATARLLVATVHAYATAPPKDDRMKKILLEAWLSDGSMIKKAPKAKFDQALAEVPEFAADVIAALSGRLAVDTEEAAK